jgi:hypothetical protein
MTFGRAVSDVKERGIASAWAEKEKALFAHGADRAFLVLRLAVCAGGSSKIEGADSTEVLITAVA